MGSGVNAVHYNSYKELFQHEEPFYMSIGMPRSEYWHEPPMLARQYRKAFEIKQKRNMETERFLAWQQGTYIESAVYSAVCYALDGEAAQKAGIKYMDYKPAEEENKEAEKAKAQQEMYNWMCNLSKMMHARYGGEKNGKYADR